MVVGPHPIEITTYDTDGSTVKAGAKVYVRNVTKKSTSSEETTNASGIANIDLANLPLISGQSAEYNTGDKILIIVYHGNNHDAAMYTVTGSSKSQTLYLNPVQHIKGLATEKIVTLVAANTSSSNYYAKVYNVNDGRLLLHVECLANSTVSIYLGGLSCGGGIAIERENKALVVTVVIK